MTKEEIVLAVNEIDGNKFHFPDMSYVTSRDAIIKVIENWCGNDPDKWNSVSYKLIDVLSAESKGKTIYAMIWISLATADKLAIALLMAAGKWK